MDNGISTSSSEGRAGSPEFWLTPVIGLALLGALILHWRSRLGAVGWPGVANDWHMLLRANPWVEIAIGIVPMFAAACLQRLMRAWKWRGWAQGVVGGLIGGLIVGVFYYYVLYPLPHGVAPPHDEGEGNVLAIFVNDVAGLAVVGGLAVVTSVVATSWLLRRKS